MHVCANTHARSHAATPLREVMIHSSARAHGVQTKALSLPREHPLLSMPDSLSVCQDRKKYIGGGLAVEVALVVATTTS